MATSLFGLDLPIHFLITFVLAFTLFSIYSFGTQSFGWTTIGIDLISIGISGTFLFVKTIAKCVLPPPSI